MMYMEMDGTQVPMVPAELGMRRADRRSTGTDAELGCVFMQTTTDPQGRPARDEASITYLGAMETAERFGRRLYTELGSAAGAGPPKNRVGQRSRLDQDIADQHFPGAVPIVGIWHAREHLWDFAAKLFPTGDTQRKRWAKKLIRKLNRGSISAVTAVLRTFPARKRDLRRLLDSEADYFERNGHHMRYPKFRKQGLFVASGVIEFEDYCVSVGRRLTSIHFLCRAPACLHHHPWPRWLR